jgi:glycine/D-amino acid oxidase-like deaminating enzyme
MKTRYGVSPWVNQFPSSRLRSYPPLRGALTADVAIVGGGLTGCAVAYACAAAGLRAVVVEEDRVGRGSAGRSAGLLLPDPGPAFRDVASAHGLRAARTAFSIWRHGALDAATTLRRLSIQCALRPVDVFTVADLAAAKTLAREHDARDEAGLDAPRLTSKQVAQLTRLEAAAAFRVRDASALDPYRACQGLAAHAVKRGAALFERSPARRIRFGSRAVDVTTDGGTIQAQTVVVATNVATAEFKPLQRHFKARETYLVLTEPVPAPMRRQLAGLDVVLRDLRTPPRRVRWTADHRLLVWGGDQPRTPPRTRDGVLVQRAGQLMYELLTMYPAISGLQPAYGWEAPYGEAADGLMYIGAHRNYPRHLFALGGPPDSVTGAFVAARMLLRALQGRPDKADEVFGWTR